MPPQRSLSLTNNPAGSIYFSQLHSLIRVDQNDENAMDRLYQEFLIYGLQNESLVVTDSHALQSPWLRSLLENDSRYPGMTDLVSHGIIRIAKRSTPTGETVPLDETAKTQIGRVIIYQDNREIPMPADYLQHAEHLERLTRDAEQRKIQVPAYSTTDLDLGSMMRMALRDASVYRSYGLSPEIANALLRDFPRFLNEDGLFMARALYTFPDEENGAYLRPYAEKVKRMAASVHSCNFALTYHLPPSTSTLAPDHVGAMSLYQKQLPEFAFLPEYDTGKPVSIADHDPIQPAENELTPRLLLDIRGEKGAFEAYIKARTALFEAFKINDARLARESTQQFLTANLDYLEHILRYLDISLPRASALQYYMTKIRKAAGEEAPSLVWLRNNLLPGNAGHVLAMRQDAGPAVLENARKASREVLLNTKRILNLI
jgi:hypothetical protein